MSPRNVHRWQCGKRSSGTLKYVSLAVKASIRCQCPLPKQPPADLLQESSSSLKFIIRLVQSSFHHRRKTSKKPHVSNPQLSDIGSSHIKMTTTLACCRF